MESTEKLSTRGAEEQLSDAEKAEIEWFRNWYETRKKEEPEATEESLHDGIISGLGYRLNIPGYRVGDDENSGAKPTDEQKTRLEELCQMVVSVEPTTGWENMAEGTENTNENDLSDKEKTEIEWFRNWYETRKKEEPEATEESLHDGIISGLGYRLNIPGYRVGDDENSGVKPTAEQQSRLEDLYKIVISSPENF